MTKEQELLAQLTAMILSGRISNSTGLSFATSKGIEDCFEAAKKIIELSKTELPNAFVKGMMTMAEQRKND